MQEEAKAKRLKERNQLLKDKADLEAWDQQTQTPEAKRKQPHPDMVAILNRYVALLLGQACVGVGVVGSERFSTLVYNGRLAVQVADCELGATGDHPWQRGRHC